MDGHGTRFVRACVRVYLVVSVRMFALYSTERSFLKESNRLVPFSAWWTVMGVVVVPMGHILSLSLSFSFINFVDGIGPCLLGYMGKQG